MQTKLEAQIPSWQLALWLAGPLLLLVGFWSPWALTPVTGLNHDGFDLAEWVSLHPAVQQGAQPRLPLTLRLAGTLGCGERRWRPAGCPDAGRAGRQS